MTFIRMIKLPMTIRAFTMCDSDGNYNVYINEDLSEDRKRKSLSHEINHIKSGDFEKEEPAHKIG